VKAASTKAPISRATLIAIMVRRSLAISGECSACCLVQSASQSGSFTFNQPVVFSVFNGSGRSHSKHSNVRGPLPLRGAAMIRCAPQWSKSVVLPGPYDDFAAGWCIGTRRGQTPAGSSRINSRNDVSMFTFVLILRGQQP
jgi:hypothetical protein